MKHIHAILFALLTLTGFGQSRTVDLNIQYGVDFTNESIVSVSLSTRNTVNRTSGNVSFIL